MGARFYAFLMLPIILVLYIVATTAALTRSGLLERKITRIFRNYFDARLTLDSIRVDPFSGLRFNKISIIPDGEYKAVFQADALVLGFTASSIFSGSLTPRTITLEGPEVLVDQKGDGAFSFKRLLEKQRFEEMMEGENITIDSDKERKSLTVMIQDGLVRLEGMGPIPTGIREFMIPEREIKVRIPSFHWADPGGEKFLCTFGGYIHHDALGEIPVEGEVDEIGLSFLSLRLWDLNVKGNRFQSYLSEAIRKIVSITGVSGDLDLKFVAEREDSGAFVKHVFFDGFNLFPDPFPVNLRSVEGRMTIHEDSLNLDWAWASAMGGMMRAEGRLNFQGDNLLNFRLEGEDIPFCPEIEMAVEKIGGGRDYRAFAPRGKADFTFNGYVKRGAKRVKGDLAIWPQGASASYEGYFDPITGLKDAFPYRLYDIRGEILALLERRVELNAVEGYSSPHSGDGDGMATRGRVLVHGQVGIKESGFPMDIQIVGQDLLVDEALLNAVRLKEPDTVRFIKEYNPSGRIDVIATLNHPAHEYAPPNIFVKLKDVSACYEGFPYPVEQIRGEIRHDGERIFFQDIRGFRSGVPGEAQGFQETDPDSGVMNRSDRSGQLRLDALIKHERVERFFLRGSHQYITPKVRDALLYTLPERFRFLTNIEYQGTTDFSILLEERPTGEIFMVDLNLYLDRVQGGKLPTMLEDLRGSVHLDWSEGILEGSDVTVRIGEGHFAFEKLKVMQTEDDGLSIIAKGSGTNLSLDTDLSRILKGDMLEEWRSLSCGGNMDLDSLEVEAEITERGSVKNLLCRMDIRLHGGRITHPLEISDIYGDLALHIQKDPTVKTDFALKGKTKGTSFALPDDRLFTHVTADFELDDKALVFPHFQGNFYGGNISGAGEVPLRINFNPPRPFEGHFQMENADLKHFFDRDSYAARNLAGKVSVDLDFNGEIDNPHRTRAAGGVYITEGSLFELPVFGNLARLMGNVFSTEPPTFTGGEATFGVEEGVITLDDIELDSTLMKLNGSGKMTVDGMDIKFIPSTSFVPKIPIIGHIMDLLKGGFLTFKISGPYTNLDVSYEHLVNRLFSGDKVPEEPRYEGRIEYEFAERF